MSSLISLPLRLGVRTARASLQATRDLADLGLATLELVGRVLGEHPGGARDEADRAPEPPAAPPVAAPAPVPPPPPPPPAPPTAAAPIPPPPAPASPAVSPATSPPAPPSGGGESTGVDIGLEPEEPTPDERELVEEFADPGAEEGAGASLRVDPPFDGYDALRAPDVIAHLRTADLAELGETELYERTHRARRSVLEAIEREIRRRGSS